MSLMFSCDLLSNFRSLGVLNNEDWMADLGIEVVICFQIFVA
ncbi:MAG: hypothetical protein JWQ38_337 [Flavipsychrobacter sp.]|nr:hypothetical protein [Flavipsychrobacter sp.]